MDSLERAVTGNYVVAAESGSRYLVDFGRQTFVRLPILGDALYVAMSGDHCQVQPLHLMERTVARSSWARTNLGVPGAHFTDRRTSEVVTTLKLPDAIDAQELDSLVRELKQSSDRVDRVSRVLAEEVRLDGDR